MRPEQRSLLAVVLSVGVLMLWYTFLAPKAPPPAASKPATSVSSTSSRQPTPAAATPGTTGKPTENVALQEVVLESAKLRAVFTNQDARPQSLILKHYHSSTDEASPPIDLVQRYSAEAVSLQCRQCNFELPRGVNYHVVSSSATSVSFRWDGPDYSIERNYTLDEQRYLIEQDINVINHSQRVLQGQLGLGWTVTNPEEPQGFKARLAGPPDTQTLLYQMAGKVTHLHAKKVYQSIKTPTDKTTASNERCSGRIAVSFKS